MQLKVIILTLLLAATGFATEADRVRAINYEAAARLNAVFPIGDRMTSQSRSLALLEKRLNGGTLTAPEIAEATALRKGQRDFRRLLDAAQAAIATPGMVVGSVTWPDCSDAMSATASTVVNATAYDAAGAASAAQAAAVQRANHTGTQSADTLTDGATNKAFLATERTKLTGIATGATANSADATLLARANHTGTQSAATIIGPLLPDQLAAGTALQVLRRNAANTGLEFAAETGGGGGGPQIAFTTANVVNSNAVANTLADITGLSFAVVAGNRYRFVIHIPYEAATTTGARFTINGPAATKLSYRSEYSLTATTTTTNAGLAAYNLPAGANATSMASGTGNFAIIDGFIEPSANGTVIARFASEVASSAVTVLAGASVQFSGLQ